MWGRVGCVNFCCVAFIHVWFGRVSGVLTVTILYRIEKRRVLSGW